MRAIAVALCLGMFTACHSTPPSFNSQTVPVSAIETQLELDGQSFSTQSLLQKLQNTVHRHYPQFKSSHIDWHQRPYQFGHQKRVDLTITDVKLAETGQSLLNTASIQADYSGKIIDLIVTGSFVDKRKTFNLNDFAFAWETPLIYQSLLGSDPRYRLVIDDVILAEVDQVSAAEMRAHIDTRGIPEFYLKGKHKLTLVAGNYYTDTLIQVGEPVAPSLSLQPSLSEITVVRSDQNVPRYVRVKGQNLMAHPLFSYATIDGEFGFGAQTSISDHDGQLEWESLILIPEPTSFDQRSQHSLAYATPFGTVFKSMARSI